MKIEHFEIGFIIYGKILTTQESNKKMKTKGYQRRRQDFGSGRGNILGGRPSRGSGGRGPPPGRRRIFQNFQKIS